ncbi:hypothetical protein [Microcoleus sp. FACHB-1515]|uniref:hypothetical protein n=1 Tax=Cyanophyceae TaxID=3028117 RepID=UPI0018F053BB|nr:hypothetical protein [Microcoleus sp. FACHB-1515]
MLWNSLAQPPKTILLLHLHTESKVVLMTSRMGSIADDPSTGLLARIDARY